MATSPEQVRDDEAQYAAAFDEDVAQAPEQSEDEAFGLVDEGGDEPAGESAAAEPATETDLAADGEPAGQTELEAEGDTPGDEGEVRDEADLGDGDGSADGADDAAAAPTGEVDLAKEIQRLKSWEGRLKAMEAKLKSAPAAEPEQAETEALESVAAKTDDSELSQAASQAAEAVESGEISATDAMKQLAEDFGEDFVKMIETIATAKAREAGTAAASAKVAEVGKAVDDIIADITDSKARAHFEQIAAVHPDFQEVGQSAGFKSYIDSLPPEEKAKAEQTVATGSAKQINQLLSTYKSQLAAESPEDQEEAAAPAADPAVDAQLDAAEGVRSSGMALPEEPKPADDSYEGAWKEFA